MQSVDELEHLLNAHGVTWKYIDLTQYGLLWEEWAARYGSMFKPYRQRSNYRKPFKRGEKARYEFAQVRADHFYVLSAANKSVVPDCLYGSRFGYECWTKETVPLPDFSPLCQLEFAISPADFGWTMIHTHEDDYETPAFTRAEWQRLARS